MLEITAVRVTTAGNAMVYFKDKNANKSSSIIGEWQGKSGYGIKRLPEKGKRFRSRETLWKWVREP